jgi:SAM-dependent methyltransferase
MKKPAKSIEQHTHWESVLTGNPDMFGLDPSQAAIEAAKKFKKAGFRKILELGGGQGRDTHFFASEGFEMMVFDYSQSGLDAIKAKAEALGHSRLITAIRHDVREPLPFENKEFDGCYSHMLFCMALTTEEIERISAEIRRVLKPGGIHIYTVRHTGDAHYQSGIHHGEDLYENGGFVVHFFSREKVRRLAEGFEILGIDEFEEGELPRKLYRVTMRKKD